MPLALPRQAVWVKLCDMLMFIKNYISLLFYFFPLVQNLAITDLFFINLRYTNSYQNQCF